MLDFRFVVMIEKRKKRRKSIQQLPDAKVVSGVPVVNATGE